MKKVRTFENMYGNKSGGAVENSRTPYFSSDPNVIFIRHPIVAMEGFQKTPRAFERDPNVIYIKHKVVQYGNQGYFEFTPSEEDEFYAPPLMGGENKINCFENMARYEFEVPRNYEIHPSDVPVNVYGFRLPRIVIPRTIKKWNNNNMMLTNFEDMGSIWSKVKSVPGGAYKYAVKKPAGITYKYALKKPAGWITKKPGQVSRWFSRRIPGTEEWFKDKLGLSPDTAKALKWGAMVGVLGIAGIVGYKVLKKKEML